MMNGNVLTKAVEAETKSKGGLYIPTSTKLAYKKLEIVETEGDVGDLKVGQVVFVAERAGVEINYEGEDFMIINKRDVILIM